MYLNEAIISFHLMAVESFSCINCVDVTIMRLNLPTSNIFFRLSFIIYRIQLLYLKSNSISSFQFPFIHFVQFSNDIVNETPICVCAYYHCQSTTFEWWSVNVISLFSVFFFLFFFSFFSFAEIFSHFLHAQRSAKLINTAMERKLINVQVNY